MIRARNFAELVGDVLREVPADREPRRKHKFYK